MQKTILNNKTKHNIVIQNFEGPLDLLLYLIGKNKMSIFDISLSELTDEYIKFLEDMHELNLEITSEFVVMAATLLDIKARKLLPQIEPKEENEDEVTEEELLARIVDYKKYKEVSMLLGDMYKNNFGFYSKTFEKIKFVKNTKYEGNIDKTNLRNILVELIEKNKNKINKNKEEIKKIALYEKITVKDKVNQIVHYLRKNDNMVFNEVFNSNNCENIEIVTAFLGALELSKQKQVCIEQNYLFSDINVMKANIDDFGKEINISM